jgi:cyanate permease
MLTFLFVSSDLSLGIALFILGTAAAGMYVVNEVIWANYFGRLSLGTVRGLAAPITAIISAIGPLGMGIIYDQTGSYQAAWIMLAIAFVLAAIIVSVTKPPRPPQPAITTV